ncbi:MAG TPA: hypothetical protein VGH28_24885 [Polyangiaceae bacterium]|jgi:hypothetical protein
MSHARLLIALTALTSASILACAGGVAPESEPDGGAPPTVEAGPTSPAATDFQVRTDTRDAWLSLAQWTHFYAISATGNAGDTTQALQRLLAAGNDFATQAGALLDSASSTELAGLLGQRAKVVVAFVDHTSNGDENAVTNDQAEWRDLTTQLATFFTTHLHAASRAPSALQDDLFALDTATQNQIAARAKGDFAGEVAASDEADKRALDVADALSAALIATYGDKLGTTTVSGDAQSLELELRPLLAERAFWLRAFTIDQLQKRAAQPELDRALAAHVAVADVFTTVYGSNVGSQVELGFHNLSADAYAFLLASETGDTSAVAAIQKQWFTDQKSFVQYLASTNTSWTVGELGRVLGVDMDRTLAEIDARRTGEWDADAADYAMVLDNTRLFANVLATGLAHATPAASH